MGALTVAAPAYVPEYAPPAGARVPALPWRDPHSVTRPQLEQYIDQLERACDAKPDSADLRTCLGIAYAMHFDVYKSMDALETAVRLQPDHFWAQLKYAELLYRLRALERAEEEMLLALDLASTAGEAFVARNHLGAIRKLRRDGTQKPSWTKSLRAPALALILMMAAMSLLWVLR